VQGTHATVEAIRAGVLTLQGGAQRAVVAVAGPRWERLTEPARDTLLDYHGWFATVTEHPVQWLLLSRPDALDTQAAALDAARDRLGAAWSEEGRQVGEAFTAQLRQVGATRRLRRHPTLLVLPATPDGTLTWDDARVQLDNRAHAATERLRRMGVQAVRLDDAGLGQALRDCWFPDVPAEREPFLPVGVGPDGAATVPNGVDVDEDGEGMVYVDHGDGTGHWLLTWKLVRWPDTMTNAWLAPLLGSTALYWDVALHLEPLAREAYRETVKQRHGRHGVAIQFLDSLHLPAWDGLDRAWRQTGALAAALEGDAASVSPFRAGVTVGLRVSTPEATRQQARARLLALVSQAEGELRGCGGRWVRCRRQHHLAARSLRPEGIHALDEWLECDTQTVALLFPALTGAAGGVRPDGATAGSGTSVLYGFAGDQPVLKDPFDSRRSVTAESNSARITVAPPGAGKSVRDKFELYWLLSLGHEALVFDVEGEYDGLCGLFQARTVIPGTAGGAFNPFTFVPPSAADGEDALLTNPVRAQAQAVLGLLEVALAPKAGEGLTDAQIEAADEAIMQTYAREWTRSDGATCGGILPDDPQTWTRPAPWLECLATVLSEQADAVAVGLRRGVQRFTTGTLAGLFGEETTLAFDRPLVRVDLRRIHRSVRALAVYVCLLAVWEDQLRRPRTRAVYVDEAWQYFSLPLAGEQLEVMALRGRKHRLAPRYVFHNAEQFTRSPHADGVRVSAAMQVVMRQSEQSLPGVAALWGLSDADRQALQRAPKGSAYLATSEGNVLVDLDLTGWPILPYLLTGLQAPGG